MTPDTLQVVEHMAALGRVTFESALCIPAMAIVLALLAPWAMGAWKVQP